MQTRGKLSAVLAWMRGEDGESRLPRRIFWVAFWVRVVFITVAQKYRMRVVLDHFEFGWEMGRIARALATGHGYADPFLGHSGPTAWTAPLFPVILAGVFKIFGVYTLKSAWVILTINSVFSAAIVPAVYEIAWRCFGKNPRGLKIALWSGWLWALFPAAMQYAVHWVWEMSLSTALFTWIIVLALRVRGIGDEPDTHPKRQTARNWTIFGILWGLVALSNSSLITFLPFCGIWMILPELRGHMSRALRNATLAAFCCAAVASPWVIRNWFAFHAFVPLRANFGAELYESARPANEGFPWGPTLPLDERDPVFIHYQRVGELAFSKEQGVKAKLLIHRYRKLFIAHAFKRVYFFWVSVPHPDEGRVALEIVRELDYAFISVAGLLGLGLALRRGIPGAWLFFWALMATPLVYYLVTVQARFRHPLEPILTVLIVFLFQSAGSRSASRHSGLRHSEQDRLSSLTEVHGS